MSINENGGWFFYSYKDDILIVSEHTYKHVLSSYKCHLKASQKEKCECHVHYPSTGDQAYKDMGAFEKAIRESGQRFTANLNFVKNRLSLKQFGSLVHYFEYVGGDYGSALLKISETNSEWVLKFRSERGK